MSDDITATPCSATAGSACPVALHSLVEALIADAEDAQRAANEGRARGPVTKLPKLDSALGHYLRPGLYGFTADPGTGKTCLALQIAADCGAPAVFVTAEQSPFVLFQKLVARVTNTPIDQVEAANPTRIRELATTAAKAAEMLLFIDATAGPAPVDLIEGWAREWQRRFGATGVLLAIDSLQPWSRGLGVGLEYDLIQHGLKGLVGLATRLKAPILLLSHRNRASAGATGATQTAAKGSADFEHLAEAVLHMSTVQNSEEPLSPGRRKVDVSLAKNRFGPSDVPVTLTFDRRFQAFRP